VALVPWWAVWPFELMVVPVRRVPDLPSLAGTERDALADILRRVGVRYDNLFHTSFPYSMGFHGRPADGEEHPWWRLHAVYFPPLLRSATRRPSSFTGATGLSGRSAGKSLSKANVAG